MYPKPVPQNDGLLNEEPAPIVEFESVEVAKVAYETDAHREALATMGAVERFQDFGRGLILIDTKERPGDRSHW
jgi:hypothetical protein